MIDIVGKVKEIVRAKFLNFEGSHDWFHIERVHNLATYLQEKEGGDLLSIQLAALLHDFSDHKYNGGDWLAGSVETKKILLDLNVNSELAEKVSFIVSQVSFKGAGVSDEVFSIEAKIVQDADRLDAIGAIGIARAFSYGGSKQRPLFNSELRPELHSTPDAYLNSGSHTINHFYEKLLLLKDRMKTETAKQLAEKRHAFMKKFLEEFYQDWSFPDSKK